MSDSMPEIRETYLQQVRGMNDYGDREETDRVVADAGADFDRMIEAVRAEAIRSARDELGVYVGDEDSDWWDGYRNGQRRQNTALGEYADRIEKEAGL